MTGFIEILHSLTMKLFWFLFNMTETVHFHTIDYAGVMRLLFYEPLMSVRTERILDKCVTNRFYQGEL